MRMHEQRYSQSDTEEFDRRKNDVGEESRNYRDQYKVVRPNQGRGSSTAKTEERPENKQTVQWERENLTNHSPDPDAEQLVIVVIMDMVTFDKVFLVGFFIIAIMATSSDFKAHVLNKMQKQP